MDTIILLAAGFVLGLKHALEADHIAAVVNLRSRLAGVWWGIGHTLVLLGAGILGLVLKINIPPAFISFFEIAVGILLIFLGGNLLWKTDRPHLDEHKTSSSLVYRTSTLIHPHASFFVGVLHGFAGSGAFAVLLTTSVGTLVEGVIFISIFGLGSILGMTVISSAYNFIYSRALGNADKILNLITGGVSITLGIIIVLNHI